jgi:hypothetical protein
MFASSNSQAEALNTHIHVGNLSKQYEHLQCLW